MNSSMILLLRPAHGLVVKEENDGQAVVKPSTLVVVPCHVLTHRGGEEHSVAWLVDDSKSHLGQGKIGSLVPFRLHLEEDHGGQGVWVIQKVQMTA